MGGAIADLLPSAIGVAISPVPIIAVILMLFSARANANGPAFLAGWVLGLTAVGIIVLAISGPGEEAAGDSTSTVVSVIKLILGLLLLFVGVRQWRGRPKEGEPTELPKWMQSINSIAPGKALGLGMLLSAVNPKNTTLTIAASVAIAQANVSAGATAALLAVFVVVGSLSIAVPVLYYLVGGEAASKTLDGWKDWLGENNATVMAVLLLVMGTVIASQGLGGLID